jgi:hypothetical protein
MTAALCPHPEHSWLERGKKKKTNMYEQQWSGYGQIWMLSTKYKSNIEHYGRI